MTAYYNEIDPFAAQWLRNLIAAGHIATGDVDERSVEDVQPDDLAGYDQCHFFAGIGVWSYALRLAGWPDDRPVWTGSCPCQPFSAAGKRGGFEDARHLWPVWSRLIAERRPSVVFGEQVASKDGYTWLDLVQADLEGLGYACGPVVLPAAGFGAPHGRHRVYFAAPLDDPAVARQSPKGSGEPGQFQGGERGPRMGRSPSGVANSDGSRCGERRAGEAGDGRNAARIEPSGLRVAGELGNTDDTGSQGRGERGDSADQWAIGSASQAWRPNSPLEDTERTESARLGQHGGKGLREQETARPAGPSGVSGWWRDADWLYCTDQKYRPVEPGTFPLAHGATARVGRLRAYGNAIVAPVAAEFISAYLEGENE